MPINLQRRIQYSRDPSNDHQSTPPRRVDPISSKVDTQTPSIYQLIQPHQYIDQYIKPKEETIHDVAFFLFTRSVSIACNNQIRCFVKNHPRCIQSRSKKLRNLKSDDPVVSILLSCSFFSFKSIYFWVIHIYIRQVDHSKKYSVSVAIHFFWAGGGQKQMTARYHDCMIVFEFCYIYICIKKSQVPNLFPYCINSLWQLMTRAVLMKVSRKVVLWGADPLFT